MKLPLLFAAATLACIVYWVVGRLPLPLHPPAIPGRSWLYPVEAALERELERAGLQLSPRDLLRATAVCALLGALSMAPFHNGVLLLIGSAMLGMVPYRLIRARVRARKRAMSEATAHALIQLAQLCATREQPLTALTDALPALRAPLKSEVARSLTEARAGTPLPTALRRLAARCADNFYLHQLAELVAIHPHASADMADSLQRLMAHLRFTEALQHAGTQRAGWLPWLPRMLFVASLLPLLYLAVAQPVALDRLLQQTWFQAALVWTAVCGLTVVSLPYWLVIEE